MKMAKPDEADIAAAADAMSVLNDISLGYYPSRDDDPCEENLFDPENAEHLGKFYRLMKATLEKSPGWPSRIIGGMCYSIMFEKNQVIDPAAHTLELHPRFAEMEKQRDELLEALIKARASIAENLASLIESVTVKESGLIPDPEDQLAVESEQDFINTIDDAIAKAEGRKQ